MRRAACYLALTFLLASGAVALGQTPDFSGTWRLDTNGSRVNAGATLAGLIGAGAPETLHITQPSNGTVIVESQINESHARFYAPGVETSTPIYVGEAGNIRMSSRWEASKLVSEGYRVSASRGADTSTEVTEVFGLGADGQTLEIEVTTRSANEESTSVLTYRRLSNVGDCTSWPSPCKNPPR